MASVWTSYISSISLPMCKLYSGVPLNFCISVYLSFKAFLTSVTVFINTFFDKFTFCYNHRLQAYKNWETTFEIFDELYKKHDFDVAVCPVGTSNIEKVNKRPYTTIYDCKTEKEYYDVLKKCHANTFNSQYETFCISIFESMMLGLATIVPNTTTMPELLGKESWQLFNNIEEQKQKLSDLLTTPNMAYVCGNKNINTSRAYNIVDYCTSLENIFRGQMTKVNYYESLKDMWSN